MFFCNLGCDQGMPITVPADPCAEAELWHVASSPQHFQWVSRITPSFGKMQVKPVESSRKKIAKVVNGIAEFAEDVGTCQMDFPCAPQCL